MPLHPTPPAQVNVAGKAASLFDWKKIYFNIIKTIQWYFKVVIVINELVSLPLWNYFAPPWQTRASSNHWVKTDIFYNIFLQEPLNQLKKWSAKCTKAWQWIEDSSQWRTTSVKANTLPRCFLWCLVMSFMFLLLCQSSVLSEISTRFIVVFHLVPLVLASLISALLFKIK